MTQAPQRVGDLRVPWRQVSLWAVEWVLTVRPMAKVVASTLQHPRQAMVTVAARTESGLNLRRSDS